MLKIFAALASSFLLLASSGCTMNHPAPEPAHLTVMTFNDRYSAAKDGINAWANRKALFLQTIKNHDPDLLGCQETLLTQAEFLQENFPDFGFVGTGRDDGKTKGEYSPILYRKSRFELLDSGQFWLSPTPEKIGVKGWDAALPRICTWVRLHDKIADVDLYYFNSHWDHRGEIAREESGKLIRKMAAEKAKNPNGTMSPVIVTGDFNSFETDGGYQALVSPGSDGLTLIDSYRERNPPPAPDQATFHEFKGTTQGNRIDYILHSPDFRAANLEIDHTHEGAVYPSDHFPVIAELVYTK